MNDTFYTLDWVLFPARFPGLEVKLPDGSIPVGSETVETGTKVFYLRPVVRR